MNATATAAPELVVAPLQRVHLGKNYRHRHGPTWQQELEELAGSLKEHGQLEPIVARPMPDGEKGELEVVAGERRYRACNIAGLPTILCIVRDVPDDQVLDLQLAENDGQHKPHPLDEAEAYAELVKRGRTPADIAARLGRDVSYVAKRLALVQLGPEGRKAFDEEQITFSVALLVARIPDRKLQAEALRNIVTDQYDGPMTLEQARGLIEQEFMLRLEKAPFDTGDAKLLPKAGACTTCPKRTGAQRELFSDVKSPDLCTDPRCHKTKVDALWQIRKKEATKGGTQVIEGAEADAAKRAEPRDGSKFVSLNADLWISGNKNTSVRKLLGKNLPPVALARDKSGAIFEVVPRADFNKVLREARGEKEGQDRKAENDYTRREKARLAKAKLRNKAIGLAIEQATVKAPKLDAGKVLRLVVRAFAVRCWNETQRRVLERRGLKAKGLNVEAAIVKLAKELDDGGLAGLGLELAMLAGAPRDGDRYGGTVGLWADATKLTGVNFDAIEKSVIEQAKEKKGGRAKAGAGVVHLADRSNPKGTACGNGGKSLTSGLKGVTCENCQRVGPAVLARNKPAGKAKKPAKKRGR